MLGVLLEKRIQEGVRSSIGMAPMQMDYCMRQATLMEERMPKCSLAFFQKLHAMQIHYAD
jgi:hypothetical protein